MRIGDFALRNSAAVNTLRVALALLGIAMLFSLPREQYPNVPLYYVHVLVPYPGATAYEVEKDVTQKIEDTLQGVEDLNSIVSIVSNGLNFTRLAFSQSLSDQQFQNHYQEVQSLIGNISLPSNALKPEVQNFTYLDFLPIVNVIVSADVPKEKLMSYARAVNTELKSISGVLRVEDKGLLNKRILITPDETALRARGMAPQEIERVIRSWNASIPGGTLQTPTQAHNIRISSDIVSVEDVGSIVVRAKNNTLTTIADIATVFENFDTQSQLIRYNGMPAVEFKIYKTGTADSITVVKEARRRVEALSHQFNTAGGGTDSVHINVFADTTKNIDNTIRVLISNAVVGFALLFLSLLLFLGWRAAVISAMEIPFTFATSFFVLKLLGITLNSSTLFALVLVLGMIVDHSVVILENITRLKHRFGKNRRAAVTEGVQEVAFPVISSTLTTVGTFFPLIFMPGFIGKFLLPVPVTITVTLIISTISALMVIPIHYMELPGKDRTHEFSMFRHIQTWLESTLETLLRFKKIVCFSILAIVAGTITMLFFVPVSLYDTEEQPFFFVDVTMPSGTAMPLSTQVMDRMEQAILEIASENDITGVLTLIGNTDPDLAEGVRIDKPHNAQFQVEIKDPYLNHNVVPMDTIIENVRTALQPIAGADSVRIRKQRTGPPAVPAIEYQIRGDDLDALEKIDIQIRRKLAGYDELYNIKSNFQSKTPSLVVRINSRKAARFGISPDYVGGTIRSFFAADEVSSIFVNNEQTKIIFAHPADTVRAKEALMFLTFPTPNGTTVPFSSFATVVEEKSLTSIYRKNSKRQVNITAEATSRERVREINENISTFARRTITDEKAPLEFAISGEFGEFANLLHDIILLFLIGIALVYVILTAEFKSYFQPFLIMMTILFTTIGVGAYLLIGRTALSISVLYSFVALVGVVVNNAIVLISTANDMARKQMLNHHNAIIQAAVQRVKPVLLTSFTTIIGILPTALGLSGKSPIWQPMAATIVTGLFFSTVTTILILPAFYELFSKDCKPKKNHSLPDDVAPIVPEPSVNTAVGAISERSSPVPEREKDAGMGWSTEIITLEKENKSTSRSAYETSVGPVEEYALQAEVRAASEKKRDVRDTSLMGCASALREKKRNPVRRARRKIHILDMVRAWFFSHMSRIFIKKGKTLHDKEMPSSIKHIIASAKRTIKPDSEFTYFAKFTPLSGIDMTAIQAYKLKIEEIDNIIQTLLVLCAVRDKEHMIKIVGSVAGEIS